MKVLLTGASGFLGQYVLRALQQCGITAVAVGRRHPRDLAGATFAAADLLATEDLATLARQVGASHLLHLAWVTEHGTYWDSPENFRWVDASTRLVQAFCEAGGRHVLVAGTCAEYDWSQGCCREDTTPLEPATVYGVAKDATRRLVTALCTQHGVRCVWGRVFFPYGAGEAPARLVPSLVAALQGQCKEFGVHALQVRDFLHASDVAQAFVTLLRSQAGGCYNLSSGQAVPVGEVVETLARLLDADPQPVLGRAPTRPAGPAVLVGHNAKLRSLGWRQQSTLAQGLAQTLRDLSGRATDQKAARHGA